MQHTATGSSQTADIGREAQVLVPNDVAAPLVSVVISTRNRADLLPRALASITAQTLGDFECIVVDDGSSEETRKAYRGLVLELGPRFRLETSFPAGSSGTGPASAKNRGLKTATGDYIAFLDDDDWWMARDHLEVAIGALRELQADYFFTNRQGMRGADVVIKDWYSDAPELVSGRRVRTVLPIFEVSSRAFCAAMSRTRAPHPGNLVTTRERALFTGGFLERLYWAEDYEYCIRLADGASKILYRSDVTTAARMPEGDSVSLTESTLRHQLDTLTALQHLRASCARPEFRRCARAREAWTRREMANSGPSPSPSYGVSMAWQAFCVFPTFSSAAFLLRHKALRGRASSGGLGDLRRDNNRVWVRASANRRRCARALPRAPLRAARAANESAPAGHRAR